MNNNIFKSPYRWATRWGNIKSNIKHLWRLPRMIWQRCTKGYCAWDLWDFADYIGTIIENGIADFKHDSLCHPVTDECSTSEQWDQILDEIAYHMSEANKDLLEFDNPYESYLYDNDETKAEQYLQVEQNNYEHQIAERKKAIELFLKWWDYLWW